MDATWRLDIGRDLDDGVAVLILGGRIGAETAGQLTDALRSVIDDGYRRVLVDLGGVDYVNSAGLMALDAAAGRLFGAGGRLALCAVREPVRLVLELAGLLGDIPIEETRAAGLARLRAEPARG